VSTIRARHAGSSGSEPVADLVFYGLYALQHRGPESAGVAVAGGRGMLVYKDMELVSQVFDEATLATLRGHLAIGYSTTGGSRWENAQPAFKTNAAGGGMAVAHNGNLTNTAGLVGQLIPQESPPRWPVQPRAASDTDVIAELMASYVGADSLGYLALDALTETAAPAGTGPDRGLCTACFPGSYPIPMPDAAVADLRPSAATQPLTLPPPNPEPEVAR